MVAMEESEAGYRQSTPRHTAEFKQKAVEPCRKSGTTYAEVARGVFRQEDLSKKSIGN